MKTCTPPTAETALCSLLLLLALAAAARCARAGDSSTGAKEINPSEPIDLRAGDVRLKFQDGQLRYLRVGDREIIRRVYFAVRDGNWATIPPRFTHASIGQTSDGFEIDLAAQCRRDPVDFTCTGQIKGTRDGKITYHAEGLANADFQSNRIGLCVLYGLPSLAEHPFSTIEPGDGKPTFGRFPKLVSPDLVGKQFRLLRYASPEADEVSCGVDGAIFDMEDQRNWGDSSFKAYAPLPFAYPGVKKGQTFAQTITISLSETHGLDKYVQGKAVHLRVGAPVPGSKVPRIVSDGASFESSPSFVDINRGREKYADAGTVTWAYTSATHLSDDDTLMENPPALVDQADTIRSFAPRAALRVGPISLGRPQRGDGAPLAGAWVAEVLKALSCAGVEEANFKLAPGLADTVLADIASHAGKPVLSVEPVAEPGSGNQAWAVVALAVQDGDATIVWLINRTPEKAHAVLEGVGPSVNVVPVDAGTSVAGVKSSGAPGETSVAVELGPYAVYRIDPRRY
jgi:hypothetical protein